MKTEHPGKPYRQHKEAEILKRRRITAQLYLQGKHLQEIAETTGVTPATAGKDLEAIREIWLQSSLRDFDAKKSEELAKIDQLETTAWEAWHRSTQPAVTEVAKVEEALRLQEPPDFGKKGAPGSQKGGKKPVGKPLPVAKMVPVKVVKDRTTRNQAGDPRFLDQVAWCIETRVKILGLLKDVNVHNNMFINWDDLMTRKPAPDPVEEKIRAAAEGKEALPYHDPGAPVILSAEPAAHREGITILAPAIFNDQGAQTGPENAPPPHTVDQENAGGNTKTGTLQAENVPTPTSSDGTSTMHSSTSSTADSTSSSVSSVSSTYHSTDSSASSISSTYHSTLSENPSTLEGEEEE